ncbi:MAG: Crp/Fnr family transcriptional regulator, partial [Acidobacteriota bacterium]
AAGENAIAAVVVDYAAGDNSLARINPMGAIIGHVYFPESGIVSLLSTVNETSTLETGIVGSEGMIGLPVFLGVKTSNSLVLVQGAGFALRMTTADFLAECASGDEMSRILKRFTYSLMTQTAQSAACNRYHPVESRMARWLLMTNDRMKSGIFQITQEFLSNMVGVRREAVNKCARTLQKRGLISYVRGNLLILNVKGLKAIACECYKVISKHDPDYAKK